MSVTETEDDGKSCIKVITAVRSMGTDPKCVITGNTVRGPVKQIN